MSVQDELWTMPQTIAWFRERTETAVAAVSEPQSPQALAKEILSSNPGNRLLFARAHSNLPPSLHFEPTPAGQFGSGQEALKVLIDATLRGLVSCFAHDVRKGTVVEIPGDERHELEFQIHPDDVAMPFGFWSVRKGDCRFVHPHFSRKIIMRLLPPARQSPTAAADDRLLARLMEITANGPLIKAKALDLCSDVDGFSDRSFERAWKRLPLDRKIGRGKHGPRAH